MTQRVQFRLLISLVCAVTLVANNPHVLAQSADKPTAAEPAKPDVAAANTAPTVDAREIKIDGRPVRGAQEAKVTVIEFDDFQCPFSARMHTALSEVMNQYGDRIRLVTRDAPNILIHPWSIRAAVNANCLASQSAGAYWEFSESVFANQQQISLAGDQSAAFATLDKMAREIGQKHQLAAISLEKCLAAQSDTEVKQSRRDAVEKVRIAGVPTVFINGEKITGVMTAQQLRERLDRALQTAAQPVPTSTTNMPALQEVAPSSAPSRPTMSVLPDF